MGLQHAATISKYIDERSGKDLSNSSTNTQRRLKKKVTVWLSYELSIHDKNLFKKVRVTIFCETKKRCLFLVLFFAHKS